MTHYTGGCQCGAVRYEVECSLDAPIACNCSRLNTPRSSTRLVTNPTGVTSKEGLKTSDEAGAQRLPAKPRTSSAGRCSRRWSSRTSTSAGR